MKEEEKEHLVRQLRERALEAYSQEHYEEAADLLSEELRLSPDRAISHEILADCLLELGRLDAAREEFQRTIVLNPNMRLAYSGMGELLLCEARAKEAEAYFRKRIEIRPDAGGYRHLTEALRRQRLNRGSHD